MGACVRMSALFVMSSMSSAQAGPLRTCVIHTRKKRQLCVSKESPIPVSPPHAAQPFHGILDAIPFSFQKMPPYLLSRLVGIHLLHEEQQGVPSSLFDTVIFRIGQECHLLCSLARLASTSSIRTAGQSFKPYHLVLKRCHPPG